MIERIDVEVAYVAPGVQFLRTLSLCVPVSVADAIRESRVEAECGIDAGRLGVGIWSKPASHSALLKQGDRVEIYRPLRIDPKEARRQRAKSSPTR
jgi:putative ubiquitin-RnfH superfamily antitoxin RatB of RatAB toxin-antitoxin module